MDAMQPSHSHAATRLALLLTAAAAVALLQIAVVAPAFHQGGAEADAPARAVVEETQPPTADVRQGLASTSQ